MEKALNKANGHIVQADWNEQDSSSFSYICNKPDLSNLGLTDEQVQQIVDDKFPTVTREQLLTINPDGETNTLTYAQSASGNSVAQRTSSGQLVAADAALSADFWHDLASEKLNNAADKKQVLTIQNAITLLNSLDVSLLGMSDAVKNLTSTGSARGFLPYATYRDLSYRFGYSAAPVRSTEAYDEHFVLTQPSGEISTVLTPTSITSVTSKGYVDKKTERIKTKNKIANNASSLYSSSIRFGDQHWQYLFESQENEVDPGIGGELLVTFPELPGDEDTEYTITVENVPEKVYSGDWPVWPRACAVPPVDELFIDYSDGEENGLYSPSSRLFIWSWNSEKQPDGSNKYYDASVLLDPVYQTGDWKIIVGSAYMGDECSDLDQLKELYKDIVITYTCRLSETEPSGPVHSIELHSDTEVHYDYKVTELTINNLVRCFPVDTAQQWVVSFFAGDNSPIVTLPNNMSITSIGVRGEEDTEATTLPLEWIGGIPTFEANKHYMLTFKEMIGSIYVECIELPDVHQ